MRTFAIFFLIIMIPAVIRGYREMNMEAERLRKKLGIPEDDPSNQDLMHFVFKNWFQFYFLLLIIFLTGILICFIKTN